jgi:hypothetical protein
MTLQQVKSISFKFKSAKVALSSSERVTVSSSITLECDFHRCWTVSDRSPEIVKSRMVT